MMTTGQMTSDTTGAVTRFRFTLRTAIWLSVIFGLLVSGYLSYVKLTEVPMVCVASGVFNCETVQNSVYSRFMGVPIAWFGLGMYVTLAAILLLEKRVAFVAEHGRLLLFGVVLFAFMYSMYLVYLQVVVLQALCPWCLAHEANITLLFGLTGYQLWRELNGDKAKH